MNTQTVEKKSPKGSLIMASTHIGNLEDTPLRTLHALRECELLIFEEDRPARLLLKQAGLQKNYLKYNEHQAQDTLDKLRDHLRAGKSAVYVSDQGCPSLADPGRKIVELAHAIQAPIKVIPGPSSVTSAIAACPFPMEQFLFQGFLSPESAERDWQLLNLKETKTPIVILDTPYRLDKLLESCIHTFTESRKAFLALDISGENEMYLVGSFSKLLEKVRGRKLNFVLIIKGAAQ